MASVSLVEDNAPLGPLEPDYGYSSRDSGISLGPLLRQILSIARRNLLLISAIIGTFVAVAVVVTMLTTPKYTGEASLEISDRSDQVLGNQLDPNSQQMEEYTEYDADRFLNTQINILQSRALAVRVAGRLNLYSDPKFFRAMQVDQEDFKTNEDRRTGVIELLMDNLDTKLAENTRIATVRFTSTDAQMSAAIANAFATEFIQANLQRKFDSSSYARNFVQEQLEQARARLETSEQQLNAYAREAGLIRTRDANAGSDGNATSSHNVTASSLLQINQASNYSKARRIAAQSRWIAELAQPLLS